MTNVLDTNILIRFLRKDNLQQYEKAVEWFKQAQMGKRTIIIKVLVIAETCFVLESFYKMERSIIAQALEILVSQRWLKVQNRAELLQALPRYIKGFHFVDSFLLAWSTIHKEEILTFDKKLLKQN